MGTASDTCAVTTRRATDSDLAWVFADLLASNLQRHCASAPDYCALNNLKLLSVIHSRP
jgi:hypothetical protein